MSIIILITVALLLQYTFFAIRAGMARGKSGIQAPAMTGDENFERLLRVQMNTLEQLIITLPAMWMCAAYFNTLVAAVLGLAFLVGRFIYSAAYVNNPPTRSLGMIIGFGANMLMLLCCVIAAVIKLF